MPKAPWLFLSHSGVDTGEALELKRRIEATPSAKAKGLKVWFDKDDLQAGKSWQRQLEQAIAKDCTAFAVYVGSKGVMNWVESEVSLGLSRATTDGSFPFVPILGQMSTRSALPPFAGLYQGVRDPLNDPIEMEKLLEAVLGPGAPVVLLDEPFVGLRAMSESDAGRFFGRTAEVGELVGKLAKSRLVAVVADSGSGKSSLVRAGLIPRFRGGAFADPARQEPLGRIWHVVTMRPGLAPFDNLRRAVTTASERLALSPREKAELADLIDPSKPPQCAYAVQCNLPSETTETLLVVDQFEELFTQTPEQLRKPFIDWLLGLVAPGAPLGFRVVLTVRSDYFNLCSAHEVLFDLLKQEDHAFRLKQITPKGLADLVHKPLLAAGHKDQAEQNALVGQISGDVSDRPGDLALVQMALFETWKHHRLHGLGLPEAYTAVGGVAGALAHAAEEVRTGKLDARQQDLLESIFVRLINLGDTSGATRRVARIDEFDDERRALLMMLSDEKYSRLVLAGGETIEICHEQLITQWPWLQTRITSSAISVRRLGRLIDKVVEWTRAESQGRAQYLATGAELDIFDDLKREHVAWLSSAESAYVAASKDARQYEERRRAWLFRAAVVTSFLFAMIGFVAAALYVRATKLTQIAIEQAQRADLQTAIAREQTRAAVANESRMLSALSRVAFEEGRPNDAAQVALASWPRDESDQHLRLEGTLQSLSRAMAYGRLYTWQGKHTDAVSGALLTKDERRILSWSADKTLRLWDAASGQQIGPAMKHDNGVSGALLTKDERRILSWSADETLRLWDAATGRQIGLAMKHDGLVFGALLTKDERRILSWSADETLRLWDAATEQQIGPAMRHDGPVLGALVTKDERRILSWSADKTLRLWDAATGQQIGPAMKHDSFVFGALLTKDERRILSWSADRTLRLWDAATGQQIGPAMKHDGPVPGALLTKDERRILSWSADQTVRLWDAATGQQIGPAMKHDGGVTGALLTKDERRILSWSADRTLRLWDAATGLQIGPAMKLDEAVTGALLTKDERHVLSWSADQTLRWWDAATGLQIGPAMKHDGAVTGALLMKDEGRILSWSADWTLRLWDAAIGQQIGPAMKHDDFVSGALLTRDERRILSWSADETLRWWDAATGLQIEPAMKHDRFISGALLTKDERRILSWSGDRTLRLWDAATGQQIGSAMKHDNYVSGALLTKDERRVLSWSEDQTLRWWDAATGRQIEPAMKHDSFVSGALLTKDEGRILSWSVDKTLRLWDAATSRQIGSAMKHDRSVTGALLTRDEERILSWSADGTLRLWDAGTGQQIGPAMKHDGSIAGALLTRDERRILSWSADKTLRVWDAATGQQIGPAMKHDGAIAGALLTKDGRRILSWSADRTLRWWDAATGQQIGPAMKHDSFVSGALLMKDERRILSWSGDKTLRLWDAVTGQQVGPTMKHDSLVYGALSTKDERRVLSWSADRTLRLWDATWPDGNLLQVACSLVTDHDTSGVSKRYGIIIKDPICAPDTATLVPDWKSIERAPGDSDRR